MNDNNKVQEKFKQKDKESQQNNIHKKNATKVLY